MQKTVRFPTHRINALGSDRKVTNFAQHFNELLMDVNEEAHNNNSKSPDMSPLDFSF